MRRRTIDRALLGVMVVGAALLHATCGPGLSSSRMDPAAYENAVGEAVVRQIVVETREELPFQRPYCVILGEFARGAPAQGASPTFLKRFADLEATFVPESQIGFDRGTKAAVVEKTLTSPIIVQLAAVSREGPSRYEVKAAWNYRGDAVVKRYEVFGDPATEALEVRSLETLTETRKESRAITGPTL